MMVVLLVGGLLAGSAFAQDETSLSLDTNCLADLDLSSIGVSEDVLYSSLVNALYGFDLAGGGGLQEEGAHAQFCTYNQGYENCGSCLTTTWGEKRRIFYQEWWCLGIRVWRNEKCRSCG